jgi:hypothetical protein
MITLTEFDGQSKNIHRTIAVIPPTPTTLNPNPIPVVVFICPPKSITTTLNPAHVIMSTF